MQYLHTVEIEIVFQSSASFKLARPYRELNVVPDALVDVCIHKVQWQRLLTHCRDSWFDVG